MNNKPIIKFGFRIIWRIMEISKGVIRLGHNTLLELHNSSYDTQPHSLIVNFTLPDPIRTWGQHSSGLKFIL